MDKKYVIDGEKAEVNFVMTTQDILNLEESIRDLADIHLSHPDVFFRFENYPEVVGFPNLKSAKHLLEQAKAFEINHAGQKYWLSIGKKHGKSMG